MNSASAAGSRWETVPAHKRTHLDITCCHLPGYTLPSDDQVRYEETRWLEMQAGTRAGNHQVLEP